MGGGNHNKSEKNRILANMGWMTFDKVFMLLLNLLVTVKIANHYGTLGYGSYQYAVSIVAIFEILVTFVDGRVVKKQYEKGDADDIVFTATISRVLFSAVSVILGLIFILLYQGDMEFCIMFVLLLLNTILTNLRFGMVNRFEYLLKSGKIVAAADFAAVFASLLQLLAVHWNWTITAISVIALLSSLLNFVIVLLQYRLEFASLSWKRVNRPLLKAMVKESAPLAVAASCATIYTRCDSIMLGTMLSVAEVGVYAISVKLISIVQIVLAPVRESVYPKLIQLYETDKKQYAQFYIKISSVLTWLYLFGVAVSFAVLPIVFPILNEAYECALPVYRIHVLGTFFMYNAALRAGHFTLIGQGSILMYSQIFSVIVNVILNAIGIRFWGMYGAALATVITQGLSLLLSNLCFGKAGREVFWWQIKALNPVRIVR